MSRLKTCKKFASLFLSSILFITLMICLPAGAAEESSAATNFTASDSELQNLNGTSVSLSQFKEQGPVLLYFWATWCHYCKATRPEVIKLQKANPDLEILAINVGSGDSLEKVQRYEKADPVPYTVLYDPDSKVTRSYKIEGIPHFILLDKTGAVKYSGSRLPPDSMVEALVKEQSKPFAHLARLEGKDPIRENLWADSKFMNKLEDALGKQRTNQLITGWGNGNPVANEITRVNDNMVFAACKPNDQCYHQAIIFINIAKGTVEACWQDAASSESRSDFWLSPGNSPRELPAGYCEMHEDTDLAKMLRQNSSLN